MSLITNILFRVKNIGKKPICNLKSERAPTINGFVFPLCYRCCGIAISGSLSFLYSYYIRATHQSFLVFFLLATPCAIDGLIQRFKIQESNNKRRFVTGLLFGIGLVFV